MSTLLEQASLVLIPSGYKEDTVYSVIPSDGSGDMSFTRASNGTRINSDGLVEVVAWNMVQQSSVFNVSPWAFVGGTTLTSGITDINGTSNAFRYQATGGGYKYGYQTVSSTIGQVYTHSIYAKCSSGTQQFKLTDAQQGGGSLQTVTTEWQRFTFTLTASGGNIAIELGSDGTNALDIYICFAQTNIGSTAKPYFPTTDRLNVPRLTYQNGGGGCPSLLLEKQSTNLVSYSEQFDNAWWTKGFGSVTANATTSPDGTTNADKFAEDSTNNNHYFGDDTTSATSGQLVTFTIFAKASERSWIAMRIYNGSASVIGWYNIGSGTLGTIGGGGIASITSMGNGWYRCALTVTMASSSVFLPYVFLSTGDTILTYTGTSGSGVFVWGAQAELSSYPTSYIPTTSASATRIADFATTSNISTLFGSTEGSFFIEMTADFTNASGAIPLFLRSSINSAFNRATYLQFGANNIALNVYLAGVLEASIFSGTYTQGQKLKIAFAYKQNDFVLYINGSLVGTDTSGNISASLAFIDLGTYSLAATTFQYNGAISEAILFPTRLTNTQLAQLTA